MYRNEKLSKALVRELSQIILYELNDPRMGFVTVTRAKISPDLKQAKIFISIFGEEKKKKLTLHGLNHAKGFIHKTLGKRLRIRYLPEIEFEIDESVEKASQLAKLIEEVSKEQLIDDKLEKSLEEEE